MPIIDLKSNLAYVASKVEQGVNESAIARDDAARLVKFLTSARGIVFAAKQTALDPDTALRRMTGLFKQAGLNGLPFGTGGNTQSVFSNNTQYTAINQPDKTGYDDYAKEVKDDSEAEWVSKNRRPTEDATKGSDSLDSKYFVNSKVASNLVYDNDTASSVLEEMDIVPFYFTALDTIDGRVTADYHLGFRAFFNTITDSTTGGYNPYNFVGRGESFFTYGSYGRTASLGFKVAALSESELGVLHNKVEVLRKLAAPKYSAGGYMQGNFINLTVGNVYKDMPGIITSVNATVAQNVPWEIVNRSQILPHVLDISVGFTILQSTTPRHFDGSTISIDPELLALTGRI